MRRSPAAADDADVGRFHLRFAFRNSGWTGVINRDGKRWAFGRGSRGTPAQMTKRQALDGLRSSCVRSLRTLANSELDDLEVVVIQQGKGEVARQQWVHGPLSQIAAACR